MSGNHRTMTFDDLTYCIDDRKQSQNTFPFVPHFVYFVQHLHIMENLIPITFHINSIEYYGTSFIFK